MTNKKNSALFSAFSLLGALALGGGALFYFAAAGMAGGSFGAVLHFVLFLAAFCVCLLGTGLFCVRLLAPGVGGAESLVLAFLPGCACVFFGYALIWELGGILPFLRQGPGWFLLPAWLLGGWEWFCRFSASGRGCASGKKAFFPFRALWGRIGHSVPFALLALTLGLIFAVAAVWGVLPSAGADQLKVWTYNQDQLWSVGNAASVRFGLPLQDMRVAGETLHYHFLNDATAGLLALGTGAGAWAGLCWFWNMPVLALGVLGLSCVGRHFAPRAAWLAALVPFTVFFGSTAASTLPTALFTNANAQATALLALCAGLILVQNTPVHPGRRGGAAWAAFALLCTASLCMLKSTIGALLILAVLAACLAGALTKQVRAAHWATLAGMAAGFALVYVCVLRLATNNLVFTTLSNLKNLPGAYAQYFAVPLLAGYILALGWSAAHLKMLTLPQLTVHAFAIGGMLAYVLYNHYSFSQVYFALAAVPAALLASLPAAEAAAEKLVSSGRATAKRLAAGALAVCLIGLGGLELYANQSYLRSGAQAALRCLDLRVSEKAQTTMTAEDWAAAQWLKTHTPADTIFATNRNNKQFDAAEGTFHFYTAASERRCYLESYRYGMDYDHAYAEIRRRLEKVSDAIFYHLSEADAFALARQEGIDYLVVSRLVPGAPVWQAKPVYENEDVAIYAVPEAFSG
ncbi:MAG: hypothetical protein LKJ90_02850 [Faecalibacterium sp.]|jgi:hypothetical protein|nr:hypothetical protein [Faecalibacterium sp.]